MRKSIAKIMLVTLLFLMVGLAIQTVLINPTPAFAIAQMGMWGDEYENGQGQHICICHESEEDCRPCYDIAPI